MKIRLPHAPYIANKIAIDLVGCGFVTLLSGVEPVAKVAQELLEEDIKKESSLEKRVEELMEENEDEIEFMQIDRRNMFWLIKKRLANEYGVILSYEERFSDLSHRILGKLWSDDLISYSVSENMVKNVIFNAVEKYLKSYEDIQEAVYEKMENYKRKLIPGSEEYNLVFEKLYEEELKKRGML
jgi:hypothetical protein